MPDSTVDLMHKPDSPIQNMTLDQARAVMWFRNNPRPMGELFDEGYLDQRRLEWAIEKAFYPKIRQAAKVLLQSGKRQTPPTQHPVGASGIPLPVNMTLEQARATIWPFQPLNGQQMGALLDSRQLTLKDLGFAIENARDPRVKDAAITLMLLRLNQKIEENDTYSLINIVPGARSFSEARQIQYFLFAGLILGAVLGGAIISLVYQARDILESPERTERISNLAENPLGIVVSIIIVGLFLLGGWLTNKLFDYILESFFDNRLQKLRKGKEGEDTTVSIISQVLDKQWYLFRNLRLPGFRGGDLDIVLVGPTGIWVLESKFFEGQYRNIGEHWEYHGKKRWSLMRKSPSKQAQNNAVALASFLKADSIHKRVNPAVVWVNPESLVSVENPLTPVWKLDRLPDELGNIWHGNPLSEADLTRIIEKLTRLAERNRVGETK